MTGITPEAISQIANERQRVSLASGPPSRRRRYGASTVALAKVEAGRWGPRERTSRGAPGGEAPRTRRV